MAVEELHPRNERLADFALLIIDGGKLIWANQRRSIVRVA
jgi:hypothetical protein